MINYLPSEKSFECPENKTHMNKGFLGTALLLLAISIIYHGSLIQNTSNQRTKAIENYLSLHQDTQEVKYRLTNGFKEMVKHSMENTRGQKQIKRELKACEKLEEWVDQLKDQNNLEITLKAGYVDMETYEYEERLTTTANAFQPIYHTLRKDPLKALGSLKDRATKCINYISVKEDEDTATVKNNGYMEAWDNALPGKEPSFMFEVKKGSRTQKVIIPSNTHIKGGPG